MRYFFCSWTYSTCIIVLNWKGNNVLLSTCNSICYLLMRLNIQFFQNMNRWCTKLTRNCETRAGNKLVIAFLHWKFDIIHTWAVIAITRIAKVTCTHVRSDCIVTSCISTTRLGGYAFVNIYDEWKQNLCIWLFF